MPSPTGRIVSSNQQLFDAKAANGVATNPIDCSCFTNIIVAVTAPLNTSLTFKFQGSVGKSITDASAPAFASAQAVTNMWDYVSAYDLNDPSSVIVGDTGVTIDNLSAAANTRMYIVNVALLRWFSMEVSAYTDGSISAMVMGSTI